jgi:hypothetical protein
VVGNTMASDADNAFLLGDNGGGRVTLNRNSQILDGDGDGATQKDVKWSDVFINTLKNSNDPRLGVISVTNATWNGSNAPQGGDANPADQKGMPNGKDQSGRPGIDISTDPSYTGLANYSSPSPALIQRAGPTFVLTYAESELLWAEAATRWGIGGSAAQHYQNGVTASMTYLSQYGASIPGPTIQAYVNANPLNTSTALQQINNQYWILTCTMLDFYETWSNWRRTGYPTLTPVNYPSNSTNGVIPRRFPYPTAEANTNPVNYQAAHSAVPGGDLLTGHVWWDQ